MPRWLRRWRRWALWCRLGFHDMRPDPVVPHLYWCSRPTCDVEDGGHP